MKYSKMDLSQNDTIFDNQPASELKFKIQSLTKYGHDMLIKGSFVEAGESFLNAYQLSKQMQDDFIVRGCCFNLGACYVAGGQPKLGLKYLEQALPPDENDDGLEHYADLWYNMGVAQHALGDINKAIHAYEKSQRSYHDLNWEKLEAECLSKLAVCYHLKIRLKEACDMYRKAQLIYNNLGDQNNYALCLVSETSVLTQMGDIDTCAKVLNVLLDVCQDLTDRHLQAKIYHDIGLLYISEKLFKSAGECFEQSLRCMENSDKATSDKYLHATILQNIGAVYNYMKYFKKAISFHRRSADAYDYNKIYEKQKFSALDITDSQGELNDRHSQAQVFSNLAYAYTQTNGYVDAVTSFEHAIQGAKDSGDSEAQLLATEGLAAIWFRLKDYEKAVSLYKDALSLATPQNGKTCPHTNRLVEKLSDAMRHQLRVEAGSSISEETDRFDGGFKARKGRPRFSKSGRQSLIAKGLENDSEHSLSDSVTSDDSDDDEVSQESRKNSEPSSNNKATSIHAELAANGVNFNTKTALKQSAGTSLDYDDDIPRADKEFYLASVAQNNAVRNAENEEKPPTSRTCVLM